VRATFAYAQARIGARLARHPEAAVWGHLATARTVAAYLTAARRSPVAPWLASLASTATAHEIERTLRAEVRRAVAEVAGWVTPAWRPAVGWLRHLTVVELLAGVWSGEAVAWLAPDPALAAYGGGEGALASLGLTEVAAAVRAGTSPLAAWLDGWQRRWPDASPAPLADRLRRLGSPSLGAGDAAQGVRRALLHLIHRQAAEPVVPLAYLTLVVLDLATLRGELVARACFEGGEG